MEMPQSKAISLTSIYVSLRQSLINPGDFWVWSTVHNTTCLASLLILHSAYFVICTRSKLSLYLDGLLHKGWGGVGHRKWLPRNNASQAKFPNQLTKVDLAVQLWEPDQGRWSSCWEMFLWPGLSITPSAECLGRGRHFFKACPVLMEIPAVFPTLERNTRLAQKGRLPPEGKAWPLQATAFSLPFPSASLLSSMRKTPFNVSGLSCCTSPAEEPEAEVFTEGV